MTTAPDFPLTAPPGSAYLWLQDGRESTHTSADLWTPDSAQNDANLLRAARRILDRPHTDDHLDHRVNDCRLQEIDRDPAEPLDVSVNVKLSGRAMHALITLDTPVLPLLEAALEHMMNTPDDARLIVAFRVPGTNGRLTRITELRQQAGVTTLAFGDRRGRQPLRFTHRGTFPEHPDLRVTLREQLRTVTARAQLTREEHRLSEQQTLRTLLGEIAQRLWHSRAAHRLTHLYVMVSLGPGQDELVLDSVTASVTRRAARPQDPQVQDALASEPDMTTPLDWRESTLPGVALHGGAQSGPLLHAETALVVNLLLGLWLTPGHPTGGRLSVNTISDGSRPDLSPDLTCELHHIWPGSVRLLACRTEARTKQRSTHDLLLEDARLHAFVRACHVAEREYLQRVLT